MKKIKLKLNKTTILTLILFLAFFTRVFRLGHPKAYVFDEVYNAFTAQEIAKGNIKAWEWWNSAPQGLAYEWTHPPLGKIIMAGGVFLFGGQHWCYRLPAAFFGTGVILLIYLLGKQLFEDEKIALLAAFLASLDGLLLVMSRTGMLDIFFVFFLLTTILFFLKGKYFSSGIFLGFSLATKWIGFYLYPVLGILILKEFIFLWKNKKQKTVFKLFLTYLLFFVIVPGLIYFLSYGFFFQTGHSLSQFWELQKQMWGYHTNLKASHDYQSLALTWPLMFRPVWFWVRYNKDKIGNIYNLGNPLIWWAGLTVLPVSIIKAAKDLFKRKKFKYSFLIFCYFSFWLPWAFSPRIMFLHHYLSAIPFLCLILANFLSEQKKQIILTYLVLVVLGFMFFYPLNTGVFIPKDLVKFFFWLPSWK
ncbi:hypothetical protein COT75_02230 [Candidatus Beckwithbacteria bacterium CG10_big_fil_rev_8_21_14_0_10_34_10]|uniref:Polyprenol-phosphate-mannose--protein mannosyltransferase n=1 Tax=Candidatus Beckwithbacteria bacterium CG10_big_fil_rev_8_21_14_0_10_34_10 TaxID=1974495 RepID=A0A2H0W9G7_9BACT|nr:MAG: hypothetical protein COT75_02230 [Candidatus Beckwithbacteria bacterium CG10_big_fil_rev_8_21_14_0_10_34_10]